jgi:hypothetical protein
VTALILAEALAILLLGLLVVGLLRSHAEILRQLHQLGAGREELVGAAVEAPVVTAGARPAADLAGQTPSGEVVALAVAGAAHDTLLAFLTTGCATCAQFWEAFSAADKGLPRSTRLLVVTKGPEQESPSAIGELAPLGVTIVMTDQAWTDYQVPGAPYFVYVSGPEQRVVGEGTAVNWQQLANLVSRATEDRRAARSGRGVSPSVLAGEARVDHELMAADVHPGDPSLYPSPGEARPAEE